MNMNEIQSIASVETIKSLLILCVLQFVSTFTNKRYYLEHTFVCYYHIGPLHDGCHGNHYEIWRLCQNINKMTWPYAENYPDFNGFFIF